ncbi:DUF2690 domain-containing protein [Amycolatopsis pigmentata]|uniref:DUF2690 domain-containing protein n=1 Tax=Amycolatopsis pigmentata TaxID=450801 RepID=A0ABW5FVR4_9PSEU
MRRTRLAAAAGTISLGIALSLTGTAHAAPPAPAQTCHDTPSDRPDLKTANCDSQDPVAGGCSADASTVPGFTRSYSWGTIELRWSPSCQTNWTRFTAGYSAVWDISVERQQTKTQKHLRVNNVVNVAGGGQWYTDMVYAPGPAQACTNDVSSDNGACTGYTS